MSIIPPLNLWHFSDWDLISVAPEPAGSLDFFGPAYQLVFDSFPELPLSCVELDEESNPGVKLTRSQASTVG